MASQLEGVRELTGQLTDLGAKLATRELRGTVKAALQEAEHLARARIPQGTVGHYTHRGLFVTPGYALSTLHIEVSVNKRTGAVVATLGVGREAFYAVAFVELGTAHMAAQPWLRPSFEETQDAQLQKIADELRARVEKIARRRAAGRRL